MDIYASSCVCTCSPRQPQINLIPIFILQSELVLVKFFKQWCFFSSGLFSAFMLQLFFLLALFWIVHNIPSTRCNTSLIPPSRAPRTAGKMSCSHIFSLLIQMPIFFASIYFDIQILRACYVVGTNLSFLFALKYQPQLYA